MPSLPRSPATDNPGPDDRNRPVRLEAMVDRDGLDGVLDALAGICGEKAEHLRTNWQDKGAARTWDRWGARIAKLAARVPAAIHDTKGV